MHKLSVWRVNGITILSVHITIMCQVIANVKFSFFTNPLFFTIICPAVASSSAAAAQSHSVVYTQFRMQQDKK